jgi:hypothetical protein
MRRLVWMDVLSIKVQPEPSQGSWRGATVLQALIMYSHVWLTSTPGEINSFSFFFRSLLTTSFNSLFTLACLVHNRKPSQWNLTLSDTGQCKTH